MCYCRSGKRGLSRSERGRLDTVWGTEMASGRKRQKGSRSSGGSGMNPFSDFKSLAGYGGLWISKSGVNQREKMRALERFAE